MGLFDIYTDPTLSRGFPSPPALLGTALLEEFQFSRPPRPFDHFRLRKARQNTLISLENCFTNSM
jgi:hypothetical protein